jgi:N-acetylglutamate synthase-like GNAT family acetyltransferase
VKLRVSVRKLTAKDKAASLLIIRRTLGARWAKKANRSFSLILGHDRRPYVLADMKIIICKNKQVGIFGLYRFDTHPTNAIGIDWLAIAPEYQHMGLGTKAVKWCINEARKRKHRMIFVWTSEERAAAFYENFGFRRSSMNIRPHETKILLTKKL